MHARECRTSTAVCPIVLPASMPKAMNELISPATTAIRNPFAQGKLLDGLALLLVTHFAFLADPRIAAERNAGQTDQHAGQHGLPGEGVDELAECAVYDRRQQRAAGRAQPKRHGEIPATCPSSGSQVRTSGRPCPTGCRTGKPSASSEAGVFHSTCRNCGATNHAATHGMIP